ncbi:MAG: hypothetical protein ACREN7_10070, partial [Candidatus Dormibacteria bacterium]
VWLRAVSDLLQQPPRLRSLRRDLQQLLRPAEVRAFEARAEALVESGTYPELHGFYGRPFEW